MVRKGMCKLHVHFQDTDIGLEYCGDTQGDLDHYDFTLPSQSQNSRLTPVGVARETAETCAGIVCVHMHICMYSTVCMHAFCLKTQVCICLYVCLHVHV